MVNIKLFEVNTSFHDNTYSFVCIELGDHPSCHGHMVDEVNIRNELFNIKPGDYFLDVGACYGSYTLPALAAGAIKTYSWSPQSHHMLLSEKMILEVSLKLNGWQDKGTVYETGLADKDGWIDIGRNIWYSTLEEAVAEYVHPQSVNTLTDLIQVSTLDKWYSTIPEAEKVNMRKANVWMKMDTEGWEAKILDGAAVVMEELKPIILIENNLLMEPDPEVKTRLEKLSYYEEITVPYHTRSFTIFRKQ